MPPVIDEDGWITAVDDTRDTRKTSAQPKPKLTVESVPSDASSSTGSVSSFTTSMTTTSASASTKSTSTETTTKSTTDSSTSCSSPTKTRARASALRLHSVGVDPSLLIGKTLQQIRRSPAHPNITLYFSDKTVYQILVDGYDVRHRGVPRTLEMDDSLQGIFNPPGGHVFVELSIDDCALISLSDKAFHASQREQNPFRELRPGSEAQSEQHWNQKHVAVAFKFAGEVKWHCVWATLAEYDEETGRCTFRSYDDVYLQPLMRQSTNRDRESCASPRKTTRHKIW